MSFPWESMNRGTFFVLDDPVSVEFKDFHVFETFPVDDHADEGDFLVEA